MQYDFKTSDLPLFSQGAVVAEPGRDYDAGGNSQGEGPEAPRQWIEVLVDYPGTEEKLFTYRVPPDLEVQPGDILSVPFGAQQLGAIAVRFQERLPAYLPESKVRDIEDRIIAGYFPPDYWQLLERVAEYYYAPLLQVIRTALPPGLLARSQRRIRLKPDAIPPGGAELLRVQAARQILTMLETQKNGDYSWKYLRGKVRNAASGLRELSKRDWIESYLEEPKAPSPQLKAAVILVGSANDPDLTPRQREILQVLRRRGGELWQEELLKICRTTSSPLKTLEKKGYLVISQQEKLRTPADLRPGGASQQEGAPKTLTAAQRGSLEVIASLDSYAQVLLHGVTGSGKTEVYMQAIAPIIQQGKSALVLVPEIGLTPQLTDRFLARFGDKIAIYHSHLSQGERYDSWRTMLGGTVQIVIGTRSAVFAPLPNLGMIVLDEEFDSSYKQEERSPTYHARTVAKWRAELVNCPLILGSATPSLETWLEVRGEVASKVTGKVTGEVASEVTGGLTGDRFYSESIFSRKANSNKPTTAKANTYYLSLPERFHGRQMPPVEVVDMRQELRRGNRSIFSESLQEALHRIQQRRQQGILFIHRRGHSTFVSCRSCGYVVECPHCDVSLSYHHNQEATARLLCHYCGYTQLPPPQCPACGSRYFKHFGSGTQKVVEQLAKHFPQLRPIRFDSDTTRTKGAHRLLLSRFASGEADLLIGTQMLTKGLDLPQVTLVGVIAADGLLNLAEYRAAERAFQTLSQVVGRAGRGDEPGRAIVQTYTPEHPVIRAVQSHDYESFVAMELAERSALNYPPFGRLILLGISGRDYQLVRASAERLAGVLRSFGQDAAFGSGQNSYELLGPAPAGIMRIANRYRWQILLKFPPDVAIALPSLEELRAYCPTEISVTMNVDPLSLG